jgi:hypothetical protein
MGRRACTFRQADLARALKAAKAAGAEVARVEIDRDGKLVMVMGKGEGGDVSPGLNEWDTVLGTNDGADKT